MTSKLIGVAAVLIATRVMFAAPAPISQAEAESAIKSFYHELELADLNKMAAHFDESVKWYDQGPKTQAVIAETLQQYCADYPSRSFSIGAIKLKPSPSSDGVTVNFDLRFFLRNPARDDNRSGRSHVEWDLVKRDGAVKISRFDGRAAAEPAASP